MRLPPRANQRNGRRELPVVRGTSSRLSRRWRARLWRYRGLVSASCVAAAATLAPGILAPAPEPTVPLAVAARDLPGGTTLDAADVRIALVVASVAPADAPRSADGLLGRRTVVGVPAGTPLVGGIVHGEGIRPSVAPGLALAAVRLADPGIARLLEPGDRVRVLAASGEPTYGADSPTGDNAATGTQVIVPRAVVTEIQDGADVAATGGLLGTTAVADGEPLVLLAVSPDDAERLAGAALSARVTVVLVE